MHIDDGERVSEDQADWQENVTPFDTEKSLNIVSAGDLRKILKPTSTVSFINKNNEEERMDFIVRKGDPLTAGVMHDTMIVRSLMRMQQIVDLSEKDIETMSQEELVALFNIDLKIEDIHNNDKSVCIAASYHLLDPPITPTEMPYVLPMSWVRILAAEGTGGATQDQLDLVDDFRVQIT